MFNLFCLNAATITLKEKCFTDSDTVTLRDMIDKSDTGRIPNIKFKLKNLPCKIYSSEITDKIIDSGSYDFTVIGDFIAIYKNKTEIPGIQKNIKSSTYFIDPITYLENYIKTFFKNNDSFVKIDVVKSEPDIDLSDIHKNFEWQINRINYGLKDLIAQKKIKISVDNKLYDITLKISIYSNIYIAKENIGKNEYFRGSQFYKQNTDITRFNNMETLVFDASSLNNSRFISNVSTGEVLRYNLLKEVPLVRKGENIKYIFKKDAIEITSDCTLLQDGIENEKIKFRLPNGTERYGIIRQNQGSLYVE